MLSIVPNRKFHATPACNRFAALHRGLLTSEDRRGKGRIWLADVCQMSWIMDHLTASRGLTSMSFAVLEINTCLLQEPIKKHGRPGIYYTTADIPSKAIELAYMHWVLLDRDDWC